MDIIAIEGDFAMLSLPPIAFNRRFRRRRNFIFYLLFTKVIKEAVVEFTVQIQLFLFK
jgi:hypothetical protein